MKIKQLSPTLSMEISNMEQYLSSQTINKIELVVNRAKFTVIKIEKERALDGSTHCTVKELGTSWQFSRTILNHSIPTKEDMRRYFQEVMYYHMLKERFERERDQVLQEGDIF